MASEPASVEVLPALHVAEVEQKPPDQRWLIDELWLASGVGILGGQPKVCKTYLAAEISVAVAAGGAVLERSARTAGPVLFFGAEDSLCALRERFEALALVRNLKLDALPIYLVDVPVLRLDRDRDLNRLRATVDKYTPRLLVLDPFVRLARIDENSAADVSGVLASLRAIQRDYDVAVLLVHHARKSPAARPHQALRGSSDFAAWSDSNLYLRRSQARLTLFVEHRSAASPDPLELCLQSEPAPHLVLASAAMPSQNTPEAGPLCQTILKRLSGSPRPLPTTELRKQLHRRKADVVSALRQLSDQGLIERNLFGWTLVSADE